jgi:hypothetical protein
MFQYRTSQFDPRVTAIAGHLRAIEKELGSLGKGAGRRAAATASATGNQISEAIWPILNAIADRYLQAQSSAVGEAATFGNNAVKTGSKLGRDALERVAVQAKRSPLVTLLVAVGLGLLIGFAVRRK